MIVTRHGEKVFEINPLSAGEVAVDFSLNDLSDKKVVLSELLDKPVIISVFPDINTSVCSMQTRQFNQLASENSNLNFLSISNNTKAEQENWCAAEGVDMTVLHDTENIFGKAYGLYAPEIDHLSRAVYVIKTDGTIGYSEILSEITDEPDYQAVLDYVKND